MKGHAYSIPQNVNQQMLDLEDRPHTAAAASAKDPWYMTARASAHTLTKMLNRK